MAALRYFLRAQSFSWQAVSRRRATRSPKQRGEREASAIRRRRSALAEEASDGAYTTHPR
jgi:hypothetical protein